MANNTKPAHRAATAAKPTRKVLRAEDFRGKTDKQLAAEMEAELRALAAATGTKRAITAVVSPKLANGVTARTAPQSAAAVAANVAKATKATKATKAAPTPAAPAKATAATAATAATPARNKWDQDRPYKALVAPADITARDGTWRRMLILTALAATNTAAADAALKKHREFGSRKIDWRWLAAQKYIAF